MRIALIGPSFFGYLEDLAARLQARGHSAQFFDERPSNTVMGKLFVRFAPAAVKARALTAHLDQMIEAIRAADITHVLLVSTETITPDHVQTLKKAGLTVCRYGWDSVRNKPAMFALDPLMDRIASFDPEDCQRLGYTLIPLFSTISRQVPPPAKTHDLFYCTTLHSNRPQIVTRLKAALARQGMTARLMLFYHGRLLWALRYAGQPLVWPLLREISSKPFSRTDIAAATQAARIVLDVHHGAQSGLTMRTFEALSLDAVLLTTNAMAQASLPADLAARILPLDLEDMDRALDAARDRSATLQDLPEARRYGLSVDRFLDQITALLTGDPIPPTFPEKIERSL